MKILEMRPRSYDQRMDMVSRGHVRAVKEAVAREVPEKSYVLEIGCGIGELARLMIQRGCRVAGFDLSTSMVELCEERIEREGLGDAFSVRRMGVEGMDGLPGENFDAVVSTLVFSELNNDERRFALTHSARVLKPRGRIVVADEVVPVKAVRRVAHAVLRLPVLMLSYLVSGKSTRPIESLENEITDAGFIVEKELRSHGDSFAIVVGRKKN